jgi:hypothetical protein
MKKALIIGLAVLSVMLYGGSAYSTEKPSATVVFPFICEVPTGTLPLNPQHLDMVYAIADVSIPVQPFGMNILILVRSYKGDLVLNDSVHLSVRDVAKNTCLGEINKISASNRSKMTQDIDGKQFYVGYIEYAVPEPASGQAIIGWGEMQTLRTLYLGAGTKLEVKEWLYTDAGFNGISDFYENPNGAVDHGDFISSNIGLLPRYILANLDPDTHNWWIIMTPSNAQGPPDGSCERQLYGPICDENENCLGNVIDIPYQVNIINVAGLPKTGPAGWATYEVHLLKLGSAGGNPCGNAANEQYVGWSYIYTVGDFNLKTAKIFPIHRIVGVAE